MKHCPLCNQEIDNYSETDVEDPFTHYNPMLGLDLWGPFDSEKKVICENKQYVHFITNGEKRLARLRCPIEDEYIDEI